MTAISVGRIVTKIMGREAGKHAIVTQLLDKNFVEITGPFELTGVKRRRVNIVHIEPTNYKLEFSKGENSDEAIVKLLKSNDEINKFLVKKL